MDIRIPTFACVLRSGGDYDPSYVRRLYRGVRRNTLKPFRFVCLTDYNLAYILNENGEIDARTLQQNWPGWWSVIELFRIQGPVVVTGLDTVIMGSLDDLFDLSLSCSREDFYMFRPFNPRNKWASGFMVWNGNWRWLYEEFNFPFDAERFRGEQKYTATKLLAKGVNVQAVQDFCYGKFYSYKHHIKNGKVPDDCIAVVFHGQPRPKDVKEKWIDDHWRSL